MKFPCWLTISHCKLRYPKLNESYLPPPDAPVHPQLTHSSTSLSTHTILCFSIPCASLPLYRDQASVPQLQVAETPGLKDPTSVHLSTHHPDPFMQIQLSFLRSHAHLLRILPTRPTPHKWIRVPQETRPANWHSTLSHTRSPVPSCLKVLWVTCHYRKVYRIWDIGNVSGQQASISRDGNAIDGYPFLSLKN